MKKLFFFFALAVLCCFTLGAQTRSFKVLYLLPFHTEEADLVNVDRIRSADDVYAVKSFELFGFWEGTKMALQQCEREGAQLEIYVRDVCFDEVKLAKVLQEFDGKQLDLIVGPLYGKPFKLAASFAASHKIPLVNPFSNRNDFLEKNPYVYKVVPAPAASPKLFDEQVLQKLSDYKLVFWTDGNNTTKWMPYFEVYCTEHSIPYTKVELADGVKALAKAFAPDKTNVVLAFYENNDVKVIQNIQNPALNNKNILLVAPESWLSIHNVDMKALNDLQFHFFTNVFVNDLNPEVELFKAEYVAFYNSNPSVERFSFQGYDITRYFVSWLQHGGDFSSVDYKPLSIEFDFLKRADGGYENQRQRLVRMHDLQFEEVTAETSYSR